MRIFYVYILMLSIPILSSGQTNDSKEEYKLYRQRMKIQSDSITTFQLNGSYIKSDFGGFLRNDTIYYSDGNILRTSEASNGYLNGWLIYYYKDGRVCLKSKLKDGEFCDTMSVYRKDGTLSSMAIYTGFGHRTITDYYNTGEINRIQKIQEVDEDKKVLKKNPTLHKQRVNLESDQYFNKSGVEITENEYHEYLINLNKNR